MFKVTAALGVVQQPLLPANQLNLAVGLVAVSLLLVVLV
jgi:hypothetical protein